MPAGGGLSAWLWDVVWREKKQSQCVNVEAHSVCVCVCCMSSARGSHTRRMAGVEGFKRMPQRLQTGPRTSKPPERLLLLLPYIQPGCSEAPGLEGNLVQVES